jgi:hypothetical protein
VTVTEDVLSSALRDATYGWLDQLETLVRDADLPSRAALAEMELVRLTKAWRALLGEHEPDEDGRCRSCSKRWRRRGYRCSVWVSAHRHLVLGDSPTDGSARHALRTERKRSPW